MYKQVILALKLNLVHLYGEKTIFKVFNLKRAEYQLLRLFKGYSSQKKWISRNYIRRVVYIYTVSQKK